jgi:hypothetical protein
MTHIAFAYIILCLILAANEMVAHPEQREELEELILTQFSMIAFIYGIIASMIYCAVVLIVLIFVILTRPLALIYDLLQMILNK